MICTLIDNDIRHHGGQNVANLWSATEWAHKILTTFRSNFDHCDDSIVDKKKDHAKPLSICFLSEYRRQLILSVRVIHVWKLIEALCDTLMRAALSVLLSTTANWPIGLRHYCQLKLNLCYFEKKHHAHRYYSTDLSKFYLCCNLFLLCWQGISGGLGLNGREGSTGAMVSYRYLVFQCKCFTIFKLFFRYYG